MHEIDQYYVIGNPVKHSLSPKIHMKFAQQVNQKIKYEALEVAEDQFVQTMDKLKYEKVSGLSVTVPFKQKMCEYVDSLDEYAKIAGAVSNVIIDKDNQWQGINLDGIGLVNDIQNNQHVFFQNKDILILGAGGATRGILAPILGCKPSFVCIANRTLSKAETLVQDFSYLGSLRSMDITQITGEYDIVINATSMSINQKLPNVSIENFKSNAFGYDLMYAPEGTVFTQWCQKSHIKSSDGKGMLLELSKEAFLKWRHVNVNTENIL